MRPDDRDDSSRAGGCAAVNRALFENLFNVPVRQVNGRADPLIDADAATACGARLDELGYDYRRSITRIDEMRDNLSAGTDLCGPNPDVQTEDTWRERAVVVERGASSGPWPPARSCNGACSSMAPPRSRPGLIRRSRGRSRSPTPG